MRSVTHQMFGPEALQRPLDVTAIENALVDLLVRGEDSDLQELGITKGVMQLVTAAEQVKVLANLGKLTTEVELGGSAANALRGMAVLGSRTSYSSCVGNDEYGRAFSARLEQLGIRNQLARVNNGSVTGTCLVVVTPDGERTLNTHLGACLSYDKSFVPEQDIARSKIFFTTGYVWDTPSQIEAVEHALKIAATNNVKVAFDVADPFVIQRWGTQLWELIKNRVDILFANSMEAEMLVGCSGKEAALKIGKSVPLAVVKDGGNGSFVCWNNEALHIPVTKVQPVDTTGAGDMFAGGFLHGLCRGYDLETCGKLATLLASDTITHMGVRLSADVTDRAAQLLHFSVSKTK